MEATNDTVGCGTSTRTSGCDETCRRGTNGRIGRRNLRSCRVQEGNGMGQHRIAATYEHRNAWFVVWKGVACTAFSTQFSGPKTCTSALALEESIDSPRDKKRQSKTTNGSERRATHTSTNTSQAMGRTHRRKSRELPSIIRRLPLDGRFDLQLKKDLERRDGSYHSKGSSHSPRCFDGSFFSTERKNLLSWQQGRRFETDPKVPCMENRRRNAIHDNSRAQLLMYIDNYSHPQPSCSFVGSMGRHRPLWTDPSNPCASKGNRGETHGTHREHPNQ